MTVHHIKSQFVSTCTATTLTLVHRVRGVLWGSERGVYDCKTLQHTRRISTWQAHCKLVLLLCTRVQQQGLCVSVSLSLHVYLPPSLARSPSFCHHSAVRSLQPNLIAQADAFNVTWTSVMLTSAPQFAHSASVKVFKRSKKKKNVNFATNSREWWIVLSPKILFSYRDAGIDFHL